MKETQSSTDISTRLRRIAEAARKYRGTAMTTLGHHIDEELLREAYRRTRKDGAVGVDGETAEAYASNLEDNLQSLAERFHTGSYRAPAVRRVHIPKGDGTSTRPIGIPTFEDKVMQRAVTMVLSAVYEEDFLNCSYGFRPGRSQHQCLEALRCKLMKLQGRWVIELDIRDCFGSLDHGVLREILNRRVRDGVIRRAIDKWLKAGVLEDGHLSYPERGSPQGGVLSPLLANIYLHEVMDVWFESMVKPVLEDEAHMLRFADDAVMVFASERDARRVLSALPKRFAKYGLTLHPDKTRLLSFRRPRRGSEVRDKSESGTFDFLGFTHHWGRTLAGKWVVKLKTARSRLQRALRRIWEWCREHRHWPVELQHGMLKAKLRGHYGYYGVVCNGASLKKFYMGVCRAWRTWLHRRGQRRTMTWARFTRLLQEYPLPSPMVVHSLYNRVAMGHAANL